MATITYDGKTIALEEGKTYTLKCEEKIFKTGIVIQLDEGEGVHKTYSRSWSSNEPSTIYNKTPKTVLDGNNGVLTLNCASKKAESNLEFYMFPMVEISGWWKMITIKSSVGFGGRINYLCVPITAVVNSNYYYEFYIGASTDDTPVELRGLDGDKLFLGDKYIPENLPIDINFPVPTKVPKPFYDWFMACCGQLTIEVSYDGSSGHSSNYAYIDNVTTGKRLFSASGKTITTASINMYSTDELWIDCSLGGDSGAAVYIYDNEGTLLNSVFGAYEGTLPLSTGYTLADVKRIKFHCDD